jgi:hypothetical protein
MVQAIIEVFKKITYFVIFLFFWMLIFSFLYHIAGNQIDLTEYTGININISYFLVIMRNTVGDVQMPNYGPWLRYSNNGGGNRITWLSTLMISYIWLLWSINLIFMFIILMNLFIAIVSISFEEVLEITSQIKYR